MPSIITLTPRDGGEAARYGYTRSENPYWWAAKRRRWFEEFDAVASPSIYQDLIRVSNGDPEPVERRLKEFSDFANRRVK
jgi:hypothetical protein